jgi:Na+/H+-translocating membrane pyrophosphatase
LGSQRTVSSKIKSKLEGAISIAYLLVVALLLKGISWIFGDEIDVHFGDKSGAIAAFIVLPISLILSAAIVFISAYFAISVSLGKDVAEDVIFRWRANPRSEK